MICNAAVVVWQHLEVMLDIQQYFVGLGLLLVNKNCIASASGHLKEKGMSPLLNIGSSKVKLEFEGL